MPLQYMFGSIKNREDWTIIYIQTVLNYFCKNCAAQIPTAPAINYTAFSNFAILLSSRQGSAYNPK